MIPAHAGRIVVLCSTSGVFTYPGMTAYCPAKWAITGFFQALTKETEPLGISVSVLFPASIRNCRSRTFLYETGIDARSVAARIACAACEGKRSAIRLHFPRRYVLLRTLEQSFPLDSGQKSPATRPEETPFSIMADGFRVDHRGIFVLGSRIGAALFE